MKKFGTGQPLLRLEDQKLLKGEGRYTDDRVFEGEAYAFILRSPYAHAELGDIDKSAAEAMDGVLLVLTGADIDALGDLPCLAAFPGSDGEMPKAPPRPILAKSHVRYVGDPVALVVGTSLNRAKDASELIEVDYKPLDAVAEVEAAAKSGAPEIWAGARGNISLRWQSGDRAAVDEALSSAHHVVRLKLRHNRVVPNPIETRTAIGCYSERQGFTLYADTQGVWDVRNCLASAVFKVEPERIRVVSDDVGGGFGMKIFAYAEQALVLHAAKLLGQPVRWSADRSEAFLADSHGRDVVSKVSLGFDKDGRILGYGIENIANFGAYLSMFGPFIPTMAALQVFPGVYQIPAFHIKVDCVLTNTPPTDAYRGAGRPEAAYMLERAMNEAAQALGLSQDEIRRRNFVPEEAFPYKNATGTEIDSGAFEAVMDEALELADWSGAEARKAEAASRGKLRGIGLAYYIECTVGAPMEEVSMEVRPEGKVRLTVGTQHCGQGHRTTFGQIMAERLGVLPEDLELVQGDSAVKSAGGGTSGSRSLQMIGPAIASASDALIERGKSLAAFVLQTDSSQISFKDGRFRHEGNSQEMDFYELAKTCSEIKELPDDLKEGLKVVASYEKQASTFPNGCHIAEAEIDPDTGEVTLLNYTVVDDLGVVINPMVVEGQVHGGVVQGIGQALMEYCQYDGDDAQILTGSFMDYAMPRADNTPPITFKTRGTPCLTNPLGVKGCGEAGTIGALPAVMNALVDALRPLGINHVDMPATAATLWRLIQESRAASPRGTARV